MTQNTTKIQGKFYPLQQEEWLAACRELTQAQLSILYYIRTSDPYNQGIEINCAEVARLLSKPDRIVHRQTISRALKELDTKGFIDLELLQVKAKVKPKGLWCNNTSDVNNSCFEGDTSKVGCEGHRTPGCDDAPSCEETPRSIATHRDRSLDTEVDRDAPRSIATHHAESGSFVEREVHPSKINKTYLDFKKTLSDAERENFQDFCKKAVSNYKQPVVDIDDWLSGKNASGDNRWEIQYKKYLAVQEKESQNVNGCTNGETHCGAGTSTNLKNFESWDASTHEGQHHTLMNLGLAKFCENATSKAWYEWAIARYPERFIEVPE